MTLHLSRSSALGAEPARQAFLLLRTAFTVLIVLGLDERTQS